MLTRDQYRKTVYRPYPPLMSSLYMSGYSNESNYQPLIDQAISMKNTLVVDGVWYYGKRDIDQGAATLFQSLSIEGNVAKVWRALEQQEQALLQSVQADLVQFVAAYQAYVPALMIAWLPEELVESAVRNELEKKLSTDAVEAVMHTLNVPNRDNFYRQAENDLVTTPDLATHVIQYRWLVSRYGADTPYTLEEAQTRLAKIDKSHYLGERKRQKEQIKQAIKQAKEALGKKRALIDAMQFLVYYRTQRTDILNRAFFEYIPKLRLLAQKQHLSYDELLYTTIQELLDGTLDKGVIEKRIQDQVMILEDGLIRCASGQEAQSIRTVMSVDSSRFSQISGQVACSGMVTGSVSVIRSPADFGKVKSGDILVTGMTTPNMVSIMRLAAGFVTDEGGITCHAAIISREMKKPCIFGTKIATQVLKDGDVVQVDADQGIVEVLHDQTI